jgi:hypothetical protein
LDDYTKYIILSHLHWIEKGITEEDISKSYKEIKNKDIFSGVNMHQIQENMGYKVNYKEVITASDYEKIKFLWLSLSSSKIDLSFVKFCTNLEEINIGCFDKVNLDVLRENTKLKHIIANGNKIENIEALYAHTNLEVINIENNPRCSLKPIAHLKNLKKIDVDLIDDEIDALMILKNNPICNMDYLVSGTATDFEKFNFPFFHIIIHKNETQVSFVVEAIEKADKFTQELKFPKELVLLQTFQDKYLDAVQKDLTARLEIITEAPVVINLEELVYYQDNYMFEYIHFI